MLLKSFRTPIYGSYVTHLQKLCYPFTEVMLTIKIQKLCYISLNNDIFFFNL